MPQKTSEKKLAARRRWRENNPEKVREIRRRHYLNNREKVREQTRQWHLNNPEWGPAYRRRHYLNNLDKAREAGLRKYGLTLADFDAMTRKQNGLCGICRQPCQKNKVLSVDHCHKTGRVRGLLCSQCNKGLGHFKDDFSILIRAANYIGWRSN